MTASAETDPENARDTIRTGTIRTGTARTGTAQADPAVGPLIRDETEADHAAIATLTEAAFADLALSPHTEQHVVSALRTAGALAVSLVAEQSGDVVGHVAFSPATVADGAVGWYVLGPVSVHPHRQGAGIGSALVRAGLERLRELGAAGCVVIGHPDYYPRFGFESRAELTFPGVPPEVFLSLSLDGTWPTGTITVHPGFAATGPEPV